MHIEQLSPDQKAKWVTIALTIVLLLASFFAKSDIRFLGIKAILLIHTYFSIRCFSRLIQPMDNRQRSIDALLIILYVIILATTVSESIFFGLMTALCLLATLKYVFAQYRPEHKPLFTRKIRVDGGATIWLLVCTIASIWGFASQAVTITLLTYTGGSIYFLIIRPLYPGVRTK